MSRALASLALVSTLVTGCVEQQRYEISGLDPASFECTVQPILDRTCAFPDCHGNPGQAFFVYSMSKTRSVGDLLRGSPLTDYELCSNVQRASAFRDGDPSLLVSKPARLDSVASQYHEGEYFFGPDSAEAACIKAWLSGGEGTEVGDGSDPAACGHPWRVRPDGSMPGCRPRNVDCNAALGAPDDPANFQ